MNAGKQVIRYEGEECPHCAATYEVKSNKIQDADRVELIGKKSSFICPCGYVFEWSALLIKQFTRHQRN